MKSSCLKWGQKQGQHPVLNTVLHTVAEAHNTQKRNYVSCKKKNKSHKFIWHDTQLQSLILPLRWFIFGLAICIVSGLWNSPGVPGLGCCPNASPCSWPLLLATVPTTSQALLLKWDSSLGTTCCCLCLCYWFHSSNGYCRFHLPPRIIYVRSTTSLTSITPATFIPVPKVTL